MRDHREVALPFGRKIDISTQHDMGDFRRRAAALLDSPGSVVEQRPERKDGKPWYPGFRKIGMYAGPTAPGPSSPPSRSGSTPGART